MRKNEERRFLECENIINKLMYLGPGSSLLEVDFDIKSEPHIRGIDGLACLEGIPEEDEKILLEEVKEKYPNGFHSRNNMGMEWMKARFENDKIKVTKKGKIKTTKIGYFFDCQKIV